MDTKTWAVVIGPRGVSQALTNPAPAAKITMAANPSRQSDQNILSNLDIVNTPSIF
jgi:hypothetical protein